MGQNATRIHSGPADITLHDSGNGYLHLGFVEDVRIRGKKLSHELIDGNIRQYSSEYRFEANLLQSDYELYKSIEDRRGTRQTIYIVGAGSMVTISNAFVSCVPDFNYEAGKPHILKLSAQTTVEDDFDKYVNLLGDEGKFEVDTDTDGMANGWTENNLSAKSLVASFRTGNAQRVTTSGTSGIITYIKLCPFESPMKITASVYAEPSGTAGDFGIETALLDSGQSQIGTLSHQELNGQLADGVSERFANTHLFVPTEEVYYIRFRIWFPTSGQTIDFDDAQLEIAPAETDFFTN